MGDDVTEFTLGGIGAYAPADFLDAEMSRPSGVHMEALGGNQDAIQGITQQITNRHIAEALPQASPRLGAQTKNWRKHLREMMIRQNESVLSFLLKPASEHAITGPVETALRRYAIRNDIDISTVRPLRAILQDISGASVQDMNNEIETILGKHGNSSLTQIRAQVSALIELYKETGERVVQSENQLKMRIEKMDKLQRRVSTIIELQTNEATSGLVSAIENYMQVAFRDMEIESQYKKLLILYQKHMLLREAIQVFRVGTTPQTEPLCPICLTDSVGTVITPCGHTFCNTCARRFTSDCGICRGNIRERVRLFFS